MLPRTTLPPGRERLGVGDWAGAQAALETARMVSTTTTRLRITAEPSREEPISLDESRAPLGAGEALDASCKALDVGECARPAYA
jgi:hypothetical protein